MRLTELIQCDIYRDGGSLEGIWNTSENKTWVVTLLVITDWSKHRDFEHKTYKLYNCNRNKVDDHTQIQKNSPEYKHIISLIQNWMLEKNIDPSQLPKPSPVNVFSRLWQELEKGNF